MSDEDLVEVMMREAARAAPWGAMLLVVMLIGGMWLKQEIKDGIAFASHTVIHDVRTVVRGPQDVAPRVKPSVGIASDQPKRLQGGMRQHR